MIILRMQGLPWSATAKDVRQHFTGLSIPDGGVHIIGGEEGDVFIAFSSDDDARKAFQRQKQPLNGSRIMLLLSSKAEMQEVIAESRAAAQAAKPDPFGTADVTPSPVPHSNPPPGLLSREGSVGSSHSQSYQGFSQGDDQRQQAPRYGESYQGSNMNAPSQSLPSQGYDTSYPPSSQSKERTSYGQSQSQMYGSRLQGNDRLKDDSFERGDSNQGLMYRESDQSRSFNSQDRNLGIQNRGDRDMGYQSESNQYNKPSGFDGQQGRMPSRNMEAQDYQSVSYGSAVGSQMGRQSSDRDMGFQDSQGGDKSRSILQSSGMMNQDDGGYQDQFEDPMEGISTSYPPAGPADNLEYPQSTDEDQRGGGLKQDGNMDTFSGLSQPMSAYGRQDMNKDAEKGKFINTRYGDAYWTSSADSESMLGRKPDDTNPFGDNQDKPYSDIQNKPFPDNQNRSFPDNMPYSSDQSRSYPDNQNRPFPDMQDRPYSDNQSGSFSDNRNRSYPDNQNRSFPDNQNRSFPDNQNRSFSNSQNQSFSDSQNQSFPNNQNRPFPGNQNTPMTEGRGDFYQNQAPAENESRGNFSDNYGTKLTDQDRFYNKNDNQGERFDITRPQSTGYPMQPDYRSREQSSDFDSRFGNPSNPAPLMLSAAGDQPSSRPQTYGSKMNQEPPLSSAPAMFDQPPDDPLYGSNMESTESSRDGFYAVRLTGLPFSTTERDVRMFLRDISIAPDGMQIHRDHRGNVTGTANVKLQGPSDIDQALKRHQQFIGKRFIDVRPCLQSEWENEKEKDVPTPEPSRRRSRSPVRNRKSPLRSCNNCIEIRGLSSSTKNSDIVDFFEGLPMRQDCIYFDPTKDGPSSGVAYVEFLDSDIARKACQKNGRQFNRRTVGIRIISKEIMEAKLTSEMKRRAGRRSPGKRSPDRRRGSSPYSRRGRSPGRRGRSPVRGSSRSSPGRNGPGRRQASPSRRDRDRERDRESSSRQSRRAPSPLRPSSNDKKDSTAEKKERKEIDSREVRSVSKGEEVKTRGSPKIDDKDRLRKSESSKETPPKALLPSPDLGKMQQEKGKDQGLLKTPKNLSGANTTAFSVGKNEAASSKTPLLQQDTAKLKKSDGNNAAPVIDFHAIRDAVSRFSKDKNESKPNPNEGLGVPENNQRQMEMSGGFKRDNEHKEGQIGTQPDPFGTSQGGPGDNMQNDAVGVSQGPFGGPRDNRQAGPMDVQKDPFSDPGGSRQLGPRDRMQGGPMDIQRGPFNGPGDRRIGPMDMTHGPPGNTYGGPRDGMQDSPMDMQRGPFNAPGENRRPGPVNMARGPPGNRHDGPRDGMQGGLMDMPGGPRDKMQVPMDRQHNTFDGLRDNRRDAPLNMQGGQFGGPGVNRQDGSLERQHVSFDSLRENRPDGQMDVQGDKYRESSVNRQQGPIGGLGENRQDRPIDMQAAPFGGPEDNRRGAMDIQASPFDGPGDQRRSIPRDLQGGPMDMQAPFGGPGDNRRGGPMEMQAGPFDGPGDHQGGPISGPGDNRRGGPFGGPGDNRRGGPFGGPGDNRRGGPMEMQAGNRQGGPISGPGDNRQGGPFGGPGDNRRSGPFGGPGDNRQGGPFAGPGDNRQGGPFDGPGDNRRGGPMDMQSGPFGGPGDNQRDCPIDMQAGPFDGPGRNRGDGPMNMQGGPLGGPGDNQRDGPMGSRQEGGMPYQQERMQVSRHEGPISGRIGDDRGQSLEKWRHEERRGREGSRDFREGRQSEERMHPPMEESIPGPHRDSERRALLDRPEGPHGSRVGERDIDRRGHGFSDRQDRDRINDMEPDGRNRRESSPKRWTRDQSNERHPRGGFVHGPDDRSFNRNGPSSRNSGRESFPGDRRNPSLERDESERMGRDSQGPRDAWMEEKRGPQDRPDRRSVDRGMHEPREREPPYDANQGPHGRPANEGNSEYVCSHIRNVPYSARWPDLAQFFSGLQIVPGGIHIMINEDGRASGHCFIEFVDAHNARLTEERQLHSLNNRRLQINACSKAMMIRALEEGGEMKQNRPQQFGGRGRGRGRGSFGPRGARFQGDPRGPFPGPGPHDTHGPRGPPFRGNRPPFGEQQRMQDERQHEDQQGPRDQMHPGRPREDQRGSHGPGNPERSRVDQRRPHDQMHHERPHEDQRRPHGPVHAERSREDQRRPNDPAHSEKREAQQEQKKPDPPKKSSKVELVIRVSPPKSIPESAPQKPQPEKPKPKEPVPEKKEAKPTPAPAPLIQSDKHKGCVVTATNLPLTITVDAIGDFFKGFSTMKGAIKLDTNEATGKATGQAKIVFTSPSEANRAIKERNNRPLNGRIVRLHVL